MTYITRG